MKLTCYMKKFWPWYLLGTIAMLVVIALDVTAPRVIQAVIDRVILGGEEKLLWPLLLGLLGIGLGRGALGYVKEFTFDWIGNTAAKQMRKDVFDHVQTMSVDFFHRHNTGELMTRIKDDVDKICVAIGFIGALAVEAAFNMAVVLICMAQLNWQLTLIPVILLPIIGFLALRMENRLGAVYEEISDETAALNTVAEENLAGVRTVKAFAREEFEKKKFRSRNSRYYELNMKQSAMAAKYQPLISLLGKVLLLALVIAGGVQVIRGKMTLGVLGAFAEYANSIIWPMEILGWLANEIASAAASWKKIKHIMGQTSVLEQEAEPVVLEKVQGQIVFDHVSLSLEGHLVLSDVSFDLEPGRTLGIMGMTGAGKSMLVNLIQRFYDPSDGMISLDQVDIRKLSLQQLRSSAAVVMQDAFLFSDTVEQNVKMGQKKKVSSEAVDTALEQADAKQFVKKLSKQEQTLIGERGVGLSGGQKQRISIARALAKKTPVLILDDSTSALDMETEQQIQQELRNVKAAKIIIGHRISSVRHADEILILQDGKVLERGNHESLMAQKGQYYQTWCVQYGEEEKAMG